MAKHTIITTADTQRLHFDRQLGYGGWENLDGAQKPVWSKRTPCSSTPNQKQKKEKFKQ